MYYKQLLFGVSAFIISANFMFFCALSAIDEVIRRKGKRLAAATSDRSAGRIIDDRHYRHPIMNANVRPIGQTNDFKRRELCGVKMCSLPLITPLHTGRGAMFWNGGSRSSAPWRKEWMSGMAAETESHGNWGKKSNFSCELKLQRRIPIELQANQFLRHFIKKCKIYKLIR